MGNSQKPVGIIGKLRNFANENRGIYLLAGIGLGMLVTPAITIIITDFHGFLENLVPEAVGIVVTVLVIDRLDRNREYSIIRDQLIRKMQSRENLTALQAVEELRVLGHLADGSLKEQDLRGAHLQDANLYQVNVEDADLRNAILYNADLYDANLKGANVTNEQLMTCKTLRWAIMPDGNRYDGRFNLYHDFTVMDAKGFNRHDPQSVAEYYDVPLEEYEAGQRWAQEHQALLEEFHVKLLS